MEYGERIRLLRERRGLSQSELAKLLGVHKQTVSDVERGKQKRFGLEAERRLKELFDLDDTAPDDSGDTILRAQEELLLYYFRRLPRQRRDMVFVRILEMMGDDRDLNPDNGTKLD